MESSDIYSRLQSKFDAAIGGVDGDAKDPCVAVAGADIVDVCTYLRAEGDLRFDSLSNLTGVDYRADGEIEIVYHLYSYEHRHDAVLKVRVPREEPVVSSVEGVWKAANWLEREVYDLLGVVFTGHSDLRRLLMPEDWIGHPLRKDFVEPEEYHGISTTRESLLR